MSAVDDVHPPADVVDGRWDERIMPAANRELVRGVQGAEIRRAEGHETSDEVRTAGLYEVPCDQSAEAVRDDIDVRRTAVATHARHVLAETVCEPLVVEAWRIAEAGKSADAVEGKVVAEHCEVRRVAENAVHEDARDWLAVRIVERIGRHRASGKASQDPNQRGELNREDS